MKQDRQDLAVSLGIWLGLFAIVLLTVIGMDAIYAQKPPSQIYMVEPMLGGSLQVGMIKLSVDKAPLTRGEFIRCKPSRTSVKIEGNVKLDNVDIIQLDCGKSGKFEVLGLRWILDLDGKITLGSRGVYEESAHTTR